MTVPVSVTSSVAGFVFPGDRVDIMLTQTVNGGGDGPPLKVSETIFRNVRVLATDQRTTGTNEEGKPEIRSAATVTFEVTPKIAEKIAVAQTLGPLSMVLRSIADNAQDLERAIATGDVKLPENADPKAEKQVLLQIAGKPIDETPTFTVGGEVSRYQRTTVPGKPTDASAAATAQPGNGVRVARGNTVIFVPLGAN
jgi:pilus assembly protein CpaB